jgi:hypothetical protein
MQLEEGSKKKITTHPKPTPPMFGQLVNSLDLSGGLEIWGQYFWARINPTASPKIPSNLWNTKVRSVTLKNERGNLVVNLIFPK